MGPDSEELHAQELCGTCRPQSLQSLAQPSTGAVPSTGTGPPLPSPLASHGLKSCGFSSACTGLHRPGSAQSEGFVRMD